MARKRKGRVKPPTADEPTVAGVLGVGLDGTDGHRRLTRTKEMTLVGGSAETHERMQETAIRFSEALGEAGKPLAQLSPAQAADLLREAIHKTGR